jgi:hypothetical protein
MRLIAGAHRSERIFVEKERLPRFIFGYILWRTGVIGKIFQAEKEKIEFSHKDNLHRSLVLSQQLHRKLDQDLKE